MRRKNGLDQLFTHFYLLIYPGLSIRIEFKILPNSVRVKDMWIRDFIPGFSIPIPENFASLNEFLLFSRMMFSISGI